MTRWQVAEAKNKLSEVLDKAIQNGPQKIIRRNRVFIVVAEDEYNASTGRASSLLDHLKRGSGLDGIELQRDNSAMRDVKW